MMSKASGFDVLEWIRAHPALKALPVGFLTDKFAPEDVALAYRHCVNAYIVKPYDFDLLREIAHFLAAWVKQTIPPPMHESDWLVLSAQATGGVPTPATARRQTSR